jgi:putative membrane protein
MVYFSIRSLSQIFTNGYALAPILITVLQADSLWVPALLLSAVIVLIILHSWLVACRFEYRWSESGLMVRQGIFQRAHLDLDYSRIQNVSVLRPFYFKPLGLVALAIDSAGSSEEEITLAALDESLAERLRERIADARLNTESTAAAVEMQDEPILIERGSLDLVIHGLSSNQAWLVLAGLLGVYSQLPDSIKLSTESVVAFFPESVADATSATIWLIGVALLLVGTALMFGLSVLASLLIYANFRLHRISDGFAVGHGALSRRELQIRQRRIQTVYIQQNWIAKYFSRFNVTLEQLTHGQSVGDGAQKMLVPAVTMAQSQMLVEDALDCVYPSIAAEPYSGVSSLYLRKRWIWLAVFGLPLLLVLFMNFPPWAVLIASTVFLGMGWMTYRSWRVLGVAVNKEHLIFRKGLIGRSYVVVPLSKIQRLKLVQTTFMQGRQVAHLSLVLASRVITVPYLPIQMARELADYALYLVEARPQSWM